MDIIDEVASPGGCTWSIYRGPLMVDFKVPVDYTITHGIEGLTRRQDVEVKVPSTDDMVLINVAEPDDCDTVDEMREAIMRDAFPVLHTAIYEEGDDEEEALDARLSRIGAAVAADIARQSDELQAVGVTFGNGHELLRTRRRSFVRDGESFREIAVHAATAFCCGTERLAPDADGIVHLVHVDVAYRARRPTSARVALALRLRATPDGKIVTPHRADAFAPSDKPTEPQPPMQRRRNEAVSWDMSPSDRAQLGEAVAALAGVALPVVSDEDA